MVRSGMRHEAESVSGVIDEVRWRWDDRDAPIRLHDAAFGEDGAPRLSAPFLRYLTAHAFTVIEADETDTCHHPRLPAREDPFTCVDCGGMGVKTVRRARYAWPMWAALERLLRVQPKRPGLPSPAVIVVAVAASRWDWRRAAENLEIAHLEDVEDIILRAFRSLRSTYQERPTPRIAWTQMSESQQHAVQDGEAD